MFNKKMKAWLAVGALAAVLAVSGCGGNGDKAKSGDAAKSGVPSIVRVGAETTFPPFEFTKDDKYVGFDLDLAEAVIKQMGSKMEFKSMGFDALIPAVQSGQIDMIASGLSANPEREKQVAFSDVYFDKNGFVIIVNKDNDSLKDCVKGTCGRTHFDRCFVYESFGRGSRSKMERTLRHTRNDNDSARNWGGCISF